MCDPEATNGSCAQHVGVRWYFADRDRSRGRLLLMGGGWPRDKDARKAIDALESEFGWTYDTTSVGKSSHAIGFLLCGDGCRHVVYGTANGTARALWGRARKCPHGHTPDRPL